MRCNLVVLTLLTLLPAASALRNDAEALLGLTQADANDVGRVAETDHQDSEEAREGMLNSGSHDAVDKDAEEENVKLHRKARRQEMNAMRSGIFRFHHVRRHRKRRQASTYRHRITNYRSTYRPSSYSSSHTSSHTSSYNPPSYTAAYAHKLPKKNKIFILKNENEGQAAYIPPFPEKLGEIVFMAGSDTGSAAEVRVAGCAPCQMDGDYENGKFLQDDLVPERMFFCVERLRSLTAKGKADLGDAGQHASTCNAGRRGTQTIFGSAQGEHAEYDGFCTTDGFGVPTCKYGRAWNVGLTPEGEELVETALPINQEFEGLEMSIGGKVYQHPDFDRILTSPEAQGSQAVMWRRNGISLQAYFNWHVTFLHRSECLPVTRPWFYVGVGTDSDGLALDLGIVAYSCTPNEDGSRRCTQVGFINWETEGNVPSLLKKVWDGSSFNPSQSDIASAKREKQGHGWQSPYRRERGEYSGTVFEECKAREDSASDTGDNMHPGVCGGDWQNAIEYSGESLSAGESGDDSWIFAHLERLTKMAAHSSTDVTHLAITGHLYNFKQTKYFYDLEGAFMRIAVGGPGPKSPFETVGYADLDELHDENGFPFNQHGVVLGVLFKDSNSNWPWSGSEPPAQASFGGDASHHWKYAQLNEQLRDESGECARAGLRCTLSQNFAAVHAVMESSLKMNDAATAKAKTKETHESIEVNTNGESESLLQAPGGSDIDDFLASLELDSEDATVEDHNTGGNTGGSAGGNTGGNLGDMAKQDIYNLAYEAMPAGLPGDTAICVDLAKKHDINKKQPLQIQVQELIGLPTSVSSIYFPPKVEVARNGQKKPTLLTANGKWPGRKVEAAYKTHRGDGSVDYSAHFNLLAPPVQGDPTTRCTPLCENLQALSLAEVRQGVSLRVWVHGIIEPPETGVSKVGWKVSATRTLDYKAAGSALKLIGQEDLQDYQVTLNVDKVKYAKDTGLQYEGSSGFFGTGALYGTAKDFEVTRGATGKVISSAWRNGDEVTKGHHGDGDMEIDVLWSGQKQEGRPVTSAQVSLRPDPAIVVLHVKTSAQGKIVEELADGNYLVDWPNGQSQVTPSMITIAPPGVGVLGYADIGSHVEHVLEIFSHRTEVLVELQGTDSFGRPAQGSVSVVLATI